MTKQVGFTLIELVVVIVILGILAVTAAPRFINLQSDARISVLEGVKGAMVDTAELVYSKAAIDGVEGEEGGAGNGETTVDIGGGELIEVKFGYPESFGESAGGLIDAMNLDESLKVCYGSSSCNTTNSSHVYVGFEELADDSEQCNVRYIEPDGTDNEGNQSYVIELTTDGC